MRSLPGRTFPGGNGRDSSGRLPAREGGCSFLSGSRRNPRPGEMSLARRAPPCPERFGTGGRVSGAPAARHLPGFPYVLRDELSGRASEDGRATALADRRTGQACGRKRHGLTLDEAWDHRGRDERRKRSIVAGKGNTEAARPRPPNLSRMPPGPARLPQMSLPAASGLSLGLNSPVNTGSGCEWPARG